MSAIEVRGVPEIHRAFAKLSASAMNTALDKGNKAAANTYAKALRPAVRPLSKRMGRAVRVHRAKSGKPNWVVGGKRSVAFFWAWVIGGTHDHGPKKAKALVWQGPNGVIVARRVRGVKPHDVVEEVAQRNEARAFEQAEQAFVKETGL